MGQPAQHGQAPADRVGARRQPFVRERLPAGVERDGVGAEQAGQRLGEVLGLPAGRGDREHGPPVRAASAAAANGRNAAGAATSKDASPTAAIARVSAGSPPGAAVSASSNGARVVTGCLQQGGAGPPHSREIVPRARSSTGSAW